MIRVLASLLFLAVAVPPLPVAAFSTGDAPAAQADPDFEAGTKAMASKDWPGLVAAMHKVVAKNDKNADAFNLLGYGQRHLGQFEAALKSYQQALAIDGRHRGAHEYIGETYLLLGNLSKAEEHLARLDSLCFFGCEEYRELKAKIAEYRAKKSS